MFFTVFGRYAINMIIIEIPGNKTIKAKHLVLDFNGTLAIDGYLIPGVKEHLLLLGQKLEIHVLTADTFGSATRELAGIGLRLEILKPENQDVQKEDYVINLGSDEVIAMGNGRNDMLMLRRAALSIALLQNEGMFAGLIENCHIVCPTIIDALNLISKPLRIAATLRK